jgi:hypothetical protein
MRSAWIESDHFWVRAKIRLKVREVRIWEKWNKKWDIGKPNKKEIKEEFIKEVTANVQNTQLDEMEVRYEIWNKIQKEII